MGYQISNCGGCRTLVHAMNGCVEKRQCSADDHGLDSHCTLTGGFRRQPDTRQHIPVLWAERQEDRAAICGRPKCQRENAGTGKLLGLAVAGSLRELAPGRQTDAASTAAAGRRDQEGRCACRGQGCGQSRSGGPRKGSSLTFPSCRTKVTRFRWTVQRAICSYALQSKVCRRYFKLRT